MSIEGHRPEEALTSSQGDLRLLVEAIPTLVWRAAPEGNIDYVNKRVLDYLGAQLDEVIGWGWMDKVHPDDVAFKAKTWLQNLESKKPHRAACRFRGADGQYRWFEVHGEPRRDSDGRVISWYGVLIDIDDQRRAEEALRESESKKAEKRPRSAAQLQATLNVIPAYAWYAAPSGGITFVNKRTADYLGLPIDHPLRFGTDIGAQWDAHIPLLHPDDQEESRKAWSTCLRTGEAGEQSFRVRNAQGGYRWFLSRAEPLRASDGNLLQWVGVNLDIEELKAAEQALRESEYKLRQIIDTVPGLLWSIGPDGELTQINQGVLDYSGMGFEDHVGYYKFHHPDDLSDALDAFSQAMQTGTYYQALSRLRRADGEYRWHQVRAQPLRDREGRIVQWYGLSVDIEERKQAEDRLRRSEAYLAEAQRLSHTGSFGWTPSTGELHWSDETFRILGYDSSVKPTIERVLQRIHPDDLAIVRQVLDETPRSEKIDTTHRLLMPDGSVEFVHVLGHALKDANGNLEIVGAVMDVTENTCLYRDLAEREGKIRRLVDANIIGVFFWDMEGGILGANDAFLRMVGYDREDLTSNRLRWTDLTPAEWRERDERAVREVNSTGIIQPYEKAYFRNDGSRVPVLIGAASFEEGGNQGVAFVLDLTERKKAEDRLRRSEAYLAEAQRLSHTGSAAYNDTTLLYWSEENYRIFGFDPREGLPSREAAVERIHPDDREQALEEGRRAVREKRDYKLEYRFLLPDGTIKHIESTAHPKFSASGELVEIFSTIIDVTERKRAEEERKVAEDRLRRSEAYLAEAQRLSHSGVAAYSETTVLWGSEETYRIWGFDPAQGVPSLETVFQRIHPDDRDQVRAEIQRVVREKTGYSIEYRIVLPDGTAKHLESIGRPMFYASGELVEIVVTHLDVTERKRAEEALRESEQRFRDYAQTASDWYWETDPDHKFIRITDYERLLALGFSPTSRIGLTRWDYATDVESEPEKWERHRSLLEARQPFRDFVYQAVRSNGSPVFYKASGKPVYDAKGAFLGYRGTGADVTATMRAEAALQESEAKFRDFAESASDWFWEIGPDYKFTLLTENAFRSNAANRIGTACWDNALDLETEPEKWRLVRATLEARQPFRDFVYCSTGGDGSPMYVKASGKPVFDASGEFRGYRGTGADVTGRVRAEAALHESEYKLRQIIEAVPGLIWSAGPAGEPNYANQRLIDYTGTPLEDFKSRNWQRLLHPDDFPESVRAFDHAVQTGRSYEAVLRLRRSDSEYRWHHVRGEPLRDREGHIIQWYGLSVDIDEGKKAEDQLRRSEAHLAEAQKLSRAGSSVYSETAILYWSEEAFRIWGFDPALGLPSREAMLQRIHPDDRDRHHREIEDALREKRDCSIEFRIVLPDGTVKDVEKIYHPVFATSGEVVEILASGIDVTERKRAEEEHDRLRQLELDLAHTNRVSMMGELAASLAHEITQPIAAARNNARAALNFLDQQPPDLGEVGEALGCVVGDADRAGLIVDRIRDHIKKAPPRKHRFDLNEAINEVIVLARSAIAENGVSVQTSLSVGLAPVEGDRVQLQQVILNLALNAAEAMSAVDEGARELLISTEQSRTNGVLVAVRDSGPGIDPQDVERVFDAFYTTKSSGVGMGLSICRSIIEAHGGRLWADANEPRGAVFQFTFPNAESSRMG